MNSLDLEKGMQLAFNEALKAFKLQEVPVGAAIFSEDQLLTSAHNEKESQKDPSAHAELIAIRKACKILNNWRLSQCILFTTLEPCPMCLAALQQARISTIYYGAFDPKGGAISLGYHLHEDVRLNHRFSATYYPLAASTELLKAFFKQKRSVLTKD